MLEWQEKCLKATLYNESQFGAILCCALFEPTKAKAYPRFEGKAYYTSDGFLLCDFVGADKRFHAGAFVGAWADLFNNCVRLADHLNLTIEERASLLHAVKVWIRWN